MRPRWIVILQAATALLWLAIGLSGLARGDFGFVPVAAAASGVLGLVAIWLDRSGDTP